MAHVIQLAVTKFLRGLKSLARNESIDTHLSTNGVSRIKLSEVSFSNIFAKVS